VDAKTRKISLFLQYLTPFEHMFIISIILSDVESDGNDIYHVVSS